MITKDEAYTISKIRPYEKTKPSYVTNLILQSAMNGDTVCEFDHIFVINGEIEELKELGYQVEHYYNQQENKYRVSWD